MIDKLLKIIAGGLHILIAQGLSLYSLYLYSHNNVSFSSIATIAYLIVTGTFFLRKRNDEAI